MSIMCKLGKSCKTTQGMCGHEKAMLLMLIVGAIAGAGHWVFGWF